MKIALIASSYSPNRGGLERHVDRLAVGLARRGADVEILAQVTARAAKRAGELEGVTVRCFPTAVGPLRLALAPGLWEQMRLTADQFDLAHIHSTHAPFALAVARAGFARLLFTPHAPVQRLVGWPYFRATQAAIARSAQILCTSKAERDLLCGRFPDAARRARVVPPGVDVSAIGAATSFARPRKVLLSVGSLERANRVDRAIAAMAGLDPSFQLIIVGDGPDRHRLQAYASDLKVSSRISFVGSVPDHELYRWLRTANVVLSLRQQHPSGLHVTEALAAGASVVASDIPVHREAAAYVREQRALFVSAVGSPLEVADAIIDAAALGIDPAVSPLDPRVPNWDSLVDSVWSLYEALVPGAPAVAEGGAQDEAGAHDGTLRVATRLPPRTEIANDMILRG